MSDLSGKRLSQKKEAPVLLVSYVCPECGMTDVRDAYDGPPSCSGDPKHLPVWMTAKGLADG